MVSSSSFEEITDNLVIPFMQQPKSSEEIKDWSRTYNGLRRRKRQEDKYLKTFTRLYPTLPTQVVMLYHPRRIPSGSSRTVQQKIFVSEKFRQKRPSGSSSGIYFRQTSGRSFVFGRSVRLLIVYLHIHDYFWSHTCRFEENLVRNLI